MAVLSRHQCVKNLGPFQYDKLLKRAILDDDRDSLKFGMHLGDSRLYFMAIQQL